MKKSVLLSGVVSLALLAACGGGGGGDSSAPPSGGTTEPSSDLQGTYTGAATVGDFATYTVNGTKLTYNVSGAVFGNISGTLTIEPMAQNAGSDTHFWKSTDNEVHIFLSQNLGLAYIPDAKNTGEDAIVLGLREVGNISNIIGKTFVYADINTGNNADGCEVTINNDGSVEYYCLIQGSGTGCWKLDNNNNRLLVTTSTTDCANWDGSNPEFYIVAKPGQNRVGFILDKVDGSGVGVGLEKKSYSGELDPTKTYEFESLDWDEDENGNIVYSKAPIKVYFDSANNKWVYEGSSFEGKYTWSGELYIDHYCYYDSSTNSIKQQSYEGAICAKVTNTTGYPTPSDTAAYYNLFIDTTDGYYMAVRLDGKDIGIGAFVGAK